MRKTELIKSLRHHKFSEKIIRVFEKVDREKFVPEQDKFLSYDDVALPIGHGQTISQPYTIAFMLKLLEIKNNQKILEVGSGSGYVLELLAHLTNNLNIFGIERIKELAESSRKKLIRYNNIKIINCDGSNGLKEEAPFDRILVSASCKNIPQKLVEQLKDDGILVAPVKNSIVVLRKNPVENKIKEYPGFSFVPFIEG